MVRTLVLVSIATLIGACVSGLWASFWKDADRRGAQDAAVLAALIDSPDRIGWRLSENLPLLRAIIWDSDGARRYPPPDGLAPLTYEFTEEDIRDLTKQQSVATQPIWERFGVTDDQLLHCRVRPAICLIYDRKRLEIALKLTDGVLAFSMPDLVWRILLAVAAFTGAAALSLWRRSEASDPSLQLDAQRLSAKRGTLEVSLSPRDLKLLTLLLDRDGAVVTKDELYDAGWGRDYMPNSRALDQHIINLRRKLDPEKNRAPVIETVHGVGYRLAK